MSFLLITLTYVYMTCSAIMMWSEVWLWRVGKAGWLLRSWISNHWYRVAIVSFFWSVVVADCADDSSCVLLFIQIGYNLLFASAGAVTRASPSVCLKGNPEKVVENADFRTLDFYTVFVHKKIDVFYQWNLSHINTPCLQFSYSNCFLQYPSLNLTSISAPVPVSSVTFTS